MKWIFPSMVAEAAGFGPARGIAMPLVLFFSLILIRVAQPAHAQIPRDVLVVGQVAEPQSLDPHTVTSLNDFRILVNVYDGLVRFKDGTLEIEPALATSWDISDDGRTYTFHLREGVRFHDGSVFDAGAVQFNLERMLDDDHPAHDTGPFPLSFMLEMVKRVEVVDPLTVRLHLEEPFAPLLSNLAYPIGLMVSPAAVMERGKDYGRHPSGTGPFRFAEWESRRRVMLERYPEYWDGPAELRTVIFRPITDPVTRVAELLSGGVDLVVEATPDQVAELRGDREFTVHEQVGPHLWYLILNTREKPFSDRRMRLAANYAIDKEALVEDLLQGTATVAAGPVPRAFGWAYDENLDPYPYDPEKARALMKEAGYGDGADVVFFVAQGGSGMLDPVQMATAIQADLAEVGIRAEIESYEWNTFLSRVNAGLEGKADMAEMAWMVNDPHTLLSLALRTDAWPEAGGFNSGYYSNAVVDSLLTVAQGATSQRERTRIYRKVQEVVFHDAPWVFIASWKQNAITSRSVQGFRLQPSFFLRLHDTYKR
jgi:peptide/nickel transport system substrate-binding protein